MSERTTSEPTPQERIKAVQVKAERRRAKRQDERSDPESYVRQLSQRSSLGKSEVRWLEERGLGGYLSGSIMMHLAPKQAEWVLSDPEVRQRLHEAR